MFGDHGLCGLLEEGAHGKSPKCLGGNLGDFGGILQRSRLSRKLLSESAYPDSVSSKKTVYQRCSSSVSSCCSSLRCLVSLICLSRKICSTLVPSS